MTQGLKQSGGQGPSEFRGRWRALAIGGPLALALGACGSLDPFDALLDTSPVEPERVSAAPPADEPMATPNLSAVPVEPLRRPSRQSERQELERSLTEDSAEAWREPAREPEAAPAPPPELPEEPDLPEMPELRSNGQLSDGAVSRGAGGTAAGNTGESASPEGSVEGQQPNQAVSVFDVEAALAGAGQAIHSQGEPTAVIYFGHGSGALDDHDRKILREVMQLRGEGQSALRVVGHSSSRTQTMDALTHGEANLDISWQRAENVAEALASLGVSRQHIRVEGRGDREPVYYEFMETGEAGNRRAEIFWETP